MGREVFRMGPNLLGVRTCKKCLKDQPLDNFYERSYVSKQGAKTCRGWKCKQCCGESATANMRAKWPEKKEYMRRKTAEGKARRKPGWRTWADSLKAAPCLDCHHSFPPECMDFDHRDPTQKTRAVSAMVATVQAKATILAEIAKCDLICANCHRIRTARQLNWGK